MIILSIRKCVLVMVGAIIFLPSFVFGGQYYVDNSCTKNGNGESQMCASEDGQRGAFNSLQKMLYKQAGYTAGDVILLRRGQIFREKLVIPFSGQSDRPITFGAYGEGVKPQIRRSFAANNAAYWKPDGNNQWRYNFVFDINQNPANIILNNEQIIGTRVFSKGAVNFQGAYWFDNISKTLFFYSELNPATYYKNIEIVIRDNGIEMTNRAFVVIENLYVGYSGWSGIMIFDKCHDIMIRNCDIAFTGGGFLPGETVRHGNGITIYKDAHDIQIINNRIWQAFDGGVSIQGFQNKLNQYNLYINNNLIWDCGYSFEFWTKFDDANVHDIYFQNNTCYSAGGWSQNQRPDPTGFHIKKWASQGNLRSIYITNNIFAGVKGTLLSWNTPGRAIAMDKNCYFPDRPSAFRVQLNDYNFAAWKVATGLDSHSIVADPMFVDPTSHNFALSLSSPCKNLGAKQIGAPVQLRLSTP
jgi:hypothetical protein